MFLFFITKNGIRIKCGLLFIIIHILARIVYKLGSTKTKYIGRF